MSSKRKFGSANELNRSEISKTSCISHSEKMLAKTSQLSHELFASKIPSSLQGSQSSFGSPTVFPFRLNTPITVYVQGQKTTSAKEPTATTSTPKKIESPKHDSNEKEKKTEGTDDNEQTTKSNEKKRKSVVYKSRKRGQSDLPPITEETKDEYDHELYHTTPTVFKPRLYNFKNPLYNLNNFEKNSFKVLAPPFWVLVDHTIAVVWFLYSGDKREKKFFICNGLLSLQDG